MKNSKPIPCSEVLHSILYYNYEAHRLVWKRRFDKTDLWNRENAHTFASIPGPKNTMRLMINGVRYLEHRIVWKMLHGSEPEQIDHKNINASDNDGDNLRPCDNFTNGYNRKRLSYKASGLPKGVDRDRDKFRARIRHEGERLSLGLFDTPELAHAAYCAAADKLHGEFARHD